MSTKYAIITKPFAKGHYIKSFEKKYKGAWDSTFTAISLLLQNIEELCKKSIAEIIRDAGSVKIYKFEFKISGTNQSRHGSGNRGIVAIHNDTQCVNVLLVYSKADVKGNNETAWWKAVIKENYEEYRDLL